MSDLEAAMKALSSLQGVLGGLTRHCDAHRLTPGREMVFCDLPYGHKPPHQHELADERTMRWR